MLLCLQPWPGGRDSRQTGKRLCRSQRDGESFNLAAGQALNLRGYRHSWAEFYLEGIGWVPVDPTRDINSKEQRYFGALPRTSHIVQNYLDQSLRVRYRGGKLSAGWEETLVR